MGDMGDMGDSAGANDLWQIPRSLFLYFFSGVVVDLAS